MQKQLFIRPLQAKDIEVLGNLHFPWSTKDETIKKWARYLDEQEKGIRKAEIIEYEKVIVGYGHLLFRSKYPHFKTSDIPEIQDLWVFEGHRGKGVGTALIRQLERIAGAKGYKKIGIGVGLYGDYGSAQKLYFHLGYAPDGQGVTYQYTSVIPGEKYPVDDDLVLWLTKKL